MATEKEKIDKSKISNQVKHVPKDAQVIMSILKELNVQDYEPRVINQLLEFTYRYVTCILDDAKVFANHARKKTIDLDDVKLATEVVLDKAFTCPPPRHVLAKLAEVRNSMPLPPIKPHCGLRLPPDRYCLSACNYKLRAANQPKKMTKSALESRSTIKTQLKNASGGGGGGVGIAKRQTVLAPKTQVVTIPKPVIKFTTTTKTTSVSGSSGVSGGINVNSGGAESGDVKMEVDMDTSASAAVGSIGGGNTGGDGGSGGVKREREDDEFEVVQ
ncbi:PREDICTED: transcription initiation factor TFIID subunit 9 [Rhagoletis zephyria]|uniref:transcription initiation factor TFIID subunit 9 n=1 Tax=Rhagoletis zephyria TaxID=28612 RepID=UPI0008115782|nr:PREDICTED: transcription initiation factor TFIID subunit 9 [Rhagoletis zephyria]XP_036334243.1 transcription initiation factor TFIID subunit 9 [Rhagoletis pomonella]